MHFLICDINKEIFDDTDPDYWKATEENAKKSLC